MNRCEKLGCSFCHVYSDKEYWSNQRNEWKRKLKKFDVEWDPTITF